MPQNTTIRPLNEEDIQSVLMLSKNLQMDTMPCSYWGLNDCDVRQLINAPSKRTVVAHIENSIAGIGTISQGDS